MIERALKQYRIYCFINLAWYALLIVLCIGSLIYLRQGNPSPEALSDDQLPALRTTFIGMAAYAWIFFLATYFLMKPVRSGKWWLGAYINICLGTPLHSLGDILELKRC
jgi:hypothetical protein